MHKPGHQFWAMASSMAAHIGASYYAAINDDVRGWIWPVRWADLENDTGFTFDRLSIVLDIAGAKGLQILPRLMLKSYGDANAVPLPAKCPVPGFVLNNNTLYGGDPGLGGLTKCYTNGGSVWTGWATLMTNPAVMDRVGRLLDALTARFANHPAFAGLMCDEILWGVAVNAQTWPAGTTEGAWYAATTEYAARIVAAARPRNSYIVINYGDGPNGNRLVHQLVGAVRRMAANVAISDTFIDPARYQPVYPLFPMSGQRTVAHIDWQSTTTDPVLLKQYADKTAELGADITAIYTRGGADSPYWAAARQVIGS